MSVKRLMAACVAAAIMPLAAMEIVADAGEFPERAEWLEGLKGRLEAWSDNVVTLLDGPGAKWEGGKVTLRLSNRPKVAHTLTGRNIVELNPNWADTTPDEVDGACIHELGHVVQDYRPLPGRAVPYSVPPAWIREGIVDWMRWCNFEGEAGRRGVWEMAKKRPKHDDSYRITAAFLDWTAKNHGGNEFIVKLNKICRDGRYSEKTWEELTGKTRLQLATMWRDEIAPKELDAADSRGVKLKVTGVAVADDTREGKREAKFLPPETRVVVPSDKQLALFRVEYDIPTNKNVRIYLRENGDPKRFGCIFGISGSGLCSGVGVVPRILHLDAKDYRGTGDMYDGGVLVKSIRLFCSEEGDRGDFHVCDAPVNVLFAKDGEKKTDGVKVLEPLPLRK